MVVAGLDDVTKAGFSFQDLRKFPDAEEKENIESIEVGVDNELPLKFGHIFINVDTYSKIWTYSR